jgi:hypothetical protein
MTDQLPEKLRSVIERDVKRHGVRRVLETLRDQLDRSNRKAHTGDATADANHRCSMLLAEILRHWHIEARD